MPLSADDLMQRCAANKLIGKKVFWYHTVGSTNVVAHQLAKAGAAEGTLVVAEMQTDGAGRGGKVWHAAEGENLLMTLVLRPACPLEDLSVITLFTALAIAEGIYELTRIRPEIKWPNDVKLGHKKCCGILLESLISMQGVEYVIVGIGLNVNQTVFSPELAAGTASLHSAAGRVFERAEVLQIVMRHLDEQYQHFTDRKFDTILSGWKSYCTMLGKEITFNFNGAAHQGVAEDITPQGFLKVRLPDDEWLTLAQAEVTGVRW